MALLLLSTFINNLLIVKPVSVTYPPPPFLWDPSGESGHCFQGIIPLFSHNKPNSDQLKTHLCEQVNEIGASVSDVRRVLPAGSRSFPVTAQWRISALCQLLKHNVTFSVDLSYR